MLHSRLSAGVTALAVVVGAAAFVPGLASAAPLVGTAGALTARPALPVTTAPASAAPVTSVTPPLATSPVATSPVATSPVAIAPSPLPRRQFSEHGHYRSHPDPGGPGRIPAPDLPGRRSSAVV